MKPVVSNSGPERPWALMLLYSLCFGCFLALTHTTRWFIYHFGMFSSSVDACIQTRCVEAQRLLKHDMSGASGPEVDTTESTKPNPRWSPKLINLGKHKHGFAQ